MAGARVSAACLCMNFIVRISRWEVVPFSIRNHAGSDAGPIIVRPDRGAVRFDEKIAAGRVNIDVDSLAHSKQSVLLDSSIRC